MIFDTIYNFFYQLFYSDQDVSNFWSTFYYDFGDGPISMSDYFSVIGTIIILALGVVALFKILGGVLRLVKPW